MGCRTSREDGGVAGCEWLRKGQVESSAALDLGLRPLVVSTLWVLWGDPRVALGRGEARSGPSRSGESLSSL